MIDAETQHILNRLHRDSLNLPPYEFEQVNFSLLLMRLAKERVSNDEITTFVGAKENTVLKWKDAVNRPRRRFESDKLIALAARYLPAERMAECGVWFS